MAARSGLVVALMALLAACRPGGVVAGQLPGHDDLPVYPRAHAVSGVVESGRATTFTYALPDGVNAPAVMSFYREALPDQHWRTLTDTGSSIMVEKSDRSASVAVSDAKDPMLLVVRVTNKP